MVVALLFLVVVSPSLLLFRRPIEGLEEEEDDDLDVPPSF